MAALTRSSNRELLNLPDCDGLCENGKCRRMRHAVCIGENCAYYQKHNSDSKAKARLRTLDEMTQEHIAQKYYKGSRPWMENEIKIGRR